MRFSIPSLLSFAVLIDPVQSNLDLYLRAIYRNFTNSATSIGRCDVCEEGDGCLFGGNIYVQGECMTNGDTWRSYDLLDSETVCIRDFTDAACTQPVDPFKNCTFENSLDTCEFGQQWTNLDDHCIKSDSPQGDFVVPYVRITFHQPDTEAACKSGDETGGNTGYTIVDDTICVRSSVVVDDVRQPGGVLNTCSDDGTTTLNVFSDRACSEQDSGLDITTLKRKAGCTSPAQEGSSLSALSDCRDVNIYCMETEFTLRLDEPVVPPSSGMITGYSFFDALFCSIVAVSLI